MSVIRPSIFSRSLHSHPHVNQQFEGNKLHALTCRLYKGYKTSSAMAVFRSVWLIFLIFTTVSVLAAPAVNVTTTTYKTLLGPAKFASEPRGRGTLGIIISCSATFAFCIWTSVHPNITPGTTVWYRIYYQCVYMLVALIIPEAIIMSAYGQWRMAHRVHTAWRVHHGHNPIIWLDTFMLWKTATDDGLGIGGAFFVVM